MTKIAINGFGRIGRCVMRLLAQHPELELVAVNDLMDPKDLAHMLRYDSVHGRFENAREEGGNLVVSGKTIRITAERDPANLPWKELGVEIVLECTGLFRDRAKAALHLEAGAKKVLISAPAVGPDRVTLKLPRSGPASGSEAVGSMASMVKTGSVILTVTRNVSSSNSPSGSVTLILTSLVPCQSATG